MKEYKCRGVNFHGVYCIIKETCQNYINYTRRIKEKDTFHAALFKRTLDGSFLSCEKYINKNRYQYKKLNNALLPIGSRLRL